MWCLWLQEVCVWKALSQCQTSRRCQSNHQTGPGFGHCGWMWCSPSKALELLCSHSKKGLMICLLLNVRAPFCFV